MSLTRLAITRPVTILMLVLALVVLGLQSRSRMPVDLYPDISFPMLFISTTYAGTGPEEMETLISKPIEDSVSTISGLKKLSSTSSEGISNVMMQFEIGTNLDTAASDVRSKLDALRNALPQEADDPVVMKLDVAAEPVVMLNMSSDRLSSIEVRRLADEVVKDRLGQLPGVAAVTVTGGDVREIQVEVDKARLEAYNLNIAQVAAALRAENLNLPSGTIKETDRNYAVRVMGEFTSPEQIYNVRIPNAAGSTNLTVGDVARVRDTVADPSVFTRLNGGSSVTVAVQKQSDSNTVKVVDEVRKQVTLLTGLAFSHEEEGKPEKERREAAKKVLNGKAPVLTDDIKFAVSFDQSTFIKEALDDVNKSLVEGALLAVLIVFLFLHSLRGTLIVALAIPTSMIASFIIMNAVGFSVNMMSMLGLSLSVGILVDDSIVVIENIHRHLKMGEPPREAAMNGRTEIGLAAMTITMVDVVVFVPIAFMGGIVGQFFRQFGIVVATATLFSLFVSFTLTPMLASRWLKSHAEEEEAEARQQANPGLFRRFTVWWETTYNALDAFYRGVLAWALDHRAVVISLGLCTMLASIATVMPKPAITTLLTRLPVFILGAALIFVIWLVISLLQGVARWLVAIVIGLPVSLGLAGFTAMIAKLGPDMPMGVLLMLMITLGIIGYSLSASRGTEQGGTFSRGGLPIAVWVPALMLIVILLPTKFGFEFMPATDRRQVGISIEMAVGTSLAETDRVTRTIEDTLLDPKQYPDTKRVSVSVGGSSGGFMSAGSSGQNLARISLELKDLEDTKISWLDKKLIGFGLKESPMMSTDKTISRINREFKNIPGARITASLSEGGEGGGAPINIEVSGNDQQRSQRVAQQIADIVRKTPGTYAVDLSWRSGRPEFQAHIDRDRAAQYGVSVAQIAGALRTSLEGDTTTKYREGGKEYDIRVSLPKAQRDLIQQLPSLVVGTTASGSPVYLYEVVDLQPAGGPTKIERTNRQRTVTVTSQLKKGAQLGNVQQLINPQIAKLDTSGTAVTWAGEAEFMADSFKSMGDALVLSILLVFMLMAALFESILSPLIIMMSVPQAMAGAIFAMTITHQSLSIVSMIGFIMLVGLVTKNSILMIDYTNTLRHERGMSRREALLQAGPTRLRPILMTTLAMIFGMLPTAIAMSKGSEMRQPMAIAVIGGLLLSLFLTLVMVPCFYEIMDSLGERFAKLKTQVIKGLGM